MDRIRSSRIAYAALVWGVVVAILAQVSLIGLWLFAGEATLAIHKEFGHAIFLGVFALLILSFAGHLSSRMKFATALLSVITAVQTEVFALLPGSPLRAFHTVLPLVIFAMAVFLAVRATPFLRTWRADLEIPMSVAPSRAN
ncbi:MAG TPA: hypothetical protein VFA17_08660 [Thermoplasmata archaeon]|jgi:hypothetical protein|nr:hypothetical protein [Thermoplasmata archaeon]